MQPWVLHWLPLAPMTLAICYHVDRCLDKCPEEFKSVFYRQYVDNIFALFRNEEHLILFSTSFSLCHKNIKFTSEKETNNKLSFLEIEISRDKNQFITLVYRSLTFCGVFCHFDSFIPRGYKFKLVLTFNFPLLFYLLL